LWHPGLIATHQRDWEIIALWFAYYQENAIDINREPFNNPISRALKPSAAMYNAMLKLCHALKDIPDKPMYYWLALMKEQKRGEYLTLGYPNVTKTLHIKYYRRFLKTLKDREVPPTYPLQYEFFQKCLTCAFDQQRKVSNNKEQKDFRDKYWNPFLDSMQNFIDHGERNSNLKSYFQGDDGLVYYHDRQTQRVKFP
ncbi:MAG TPA: hypothetical protein VIQ31_08295, partial [Phormidium sp.]